MAKKIKFRDVAQFYVGCKIQTKEGIGTFDVYYSKGHVKPYAARQVGAYDLVKNDLKWNELKPILKPLGFNPIEQPPLMLPTDFVKLIKEGYDLFGLIESGEAIKSCTASCSPSDFYKGGKCNVGSKSCNRLKLVVG